MMIANLPLTSAEIVAITVALGVLITSSSAAIVSIIVALRTKAAVDVGVAISAANAQAIAAVDSKAEVITGHVNSAATAAAAKIDALQRELEQLREMLADKKETAALLAQAAASTIKPDETPIPVIVTNEPDKPVPIIAKK